MKSNKNSIFNRITNKLLPSIVLRTSSRTRRKSQTLRGASFYVPPGTFVRRMRTRSYGLAALRRPYLWAFLRVASEFVYAYFDYSVDDSEFAVDVLAVCVDSEK